MPLKLKIFFFLIFIYFVTAQELDDDITLEKKPLVILPAKNHYHKDVADKIVAIISNQAVSVGRFNVIDRNIVNDILAEQKFQLTGMVDDDQVIEIGNLASAKEALVLDIFHFNQKGVPN
jgi:Curli production assembly/transport component CsgG.